MKKLAVVLGVILLATTSSVYALEDIVLEDYEASAVGASGTFGNPAIDYAAIGNGQVATIQGDAANKYIELVYDYTSATHGPAPTPNFWGFGVAQRLNFVWPLDMSQGSTISFDINVSGLSADVEQVITPEILAQAIDPNDGSLIGYEAFRLQDASLGTLENTGGWQTLTFNADDLTRNSAGSLWKVMGNDIVYALNILFLNTYDADTDSYLLDGSTGTIGIDNITVTNVTVIPEPTSIMLLIGSVLGLFIKRMK